MTNPTPAASGAAPALPTDAMIHAAAHAFDVSNATFLVKMRCALSAALARQEAAPAKDGYATAFYEIASVLGIGARADTPENVFRNEMLPRIVALACREASPATLTDEQIDAETKRIYASDGLLVRFPHRRLAHWAYAKGAALASPQVAPAPTFEAAFMDMPGMSSVRQHELWAEADPGHVEGRDPEGEMCWRLATFARLMVKDLATPVQVAPPLKPVAWRVSANGEYQLFNTEAEAQRERDEYEKYEREFENDPVEHETAEPLFLATPAPVAPQDDARDAARWRTLPLVIEEDFAWVLKDVDAKLKKLSTPAAKPTEEQAS